VRIDDRLVDERPRRLRGLQFRSGRKTRRTPVSVFRPALPCQLA
jgi:hypothetical protein